MNYELFDMHTHSRHSFDGRDSVADMCRAAKKINIDHVNLAGICITDHYEIGSSLFDLNKEETPKEQRPYWIEESFAAACTEKGNHENFRVLAGIELGQYTHDPTLGDKILSMYDFDFVLGSVHILRSGLDFYEVDYTKEDPAPIYRAYLEDLLETALTADFDSLAHMTYPLRYVRRDGANIDLQPFDSIHDTILRALAKRNKALEINTSGLKNPNGSIENINPCGFTMPDENLVRRFKELGGKYITLGSDSHTTDHIAVGFSRGLEILRDAGFEEPTAYVERKPIM